MLYLEDENTVRPHWMPFKNDYRCLDLEEVQTIDDCIEAQVWLSDRITDMYHWIEQTDDADYERRLRRHITRASRKKHKLGIKQVELVAEFKLETAKAIGSDRNHFISALRAVLDEELGKSEAHRLIEMVNDYSKRPPRPKA